MAPPFKTRLVEKESREERKKRVRKEQLALNIQKESSVEKQARLQKAVEYGSKHRNKENSYEKDQRLAKQRERNAQKKTATTCDGNLEELFETTMKKLDFSTCSVCKKRYVTFTEKEKCSSCNRPGVVNTFFKANNMDPGAVPTELDCLTPLEEVLIAKVHPVVSLYRTRGQQMHYSGHIINFPQDMKEFSKKLPDVGTALNSIIIVRKEGNENHAHTDFRVCGMRVRRALLWLKENNQYYNDIEIDEEALASLPQEGIMSEALRYIVPTGKDQEEQDGITTTSVPFLPPVNQNRQIESALESVAWPAIETGPIDEFRTAGYIACAFPKLFPTGEADLRQGRLKKVGESEYFKFLMLYEDGRFANHSRFPFFAMNTMLRWTALNQGKVFVKRNLTGKSIEELKS